MRPLESRGTLRPARQPGQGHSEGLPWTDRIAATESANTQAEQDRLIAPGQIMWVPGTEAMWARAFLMATRATGGRRRYTGVEEQATHGVGGVHQRAAEREGVLKTGVHTR